MGNWTKQNFFKTRNSNGQKTHEKSSPSLAIKEMKIKNTLCFHLTPVRIAIIKNTSNNRFQQGCGEKGTLIRCCWECKLVQPLWTTIWKLLNKQNIDLPCFPPIPFLGIYLKKCNSGYSRSTCTLMFIAELFTIPSYWSSHDAPLLMNGLRKYCSYAQWNFT
jgi:hypothetical protein